MVVGVGVWLDEEEFVIFELWSRVAQWRAKALIPCRKLVILEKRIGLHSVYYNEYINRIIIRTNR